MSEDVNFDTVTGQIQTGTVDVTPLSGSEGGMTGAGSYPTYSPTYSVADYSSQYGGDGGQGYGGNSGGASAGIRREGDYTFYYDENGNEQAQYSPAPVAPVVAPINRTTDFWTPVKDAAKFVGDKLTGASGGRPALITGFLPAAAAPLAIPALFTYGMTALGFKPDENHDAMAVAINDAASVTFDGYGTPRDPITVYGLETFPTLTSGAGMAQAPNDPTKGIGNVGGNSGSRSGGSFGGGGGGSGNSPGPVVVETGDNAQLTAMLAAIAAFAFSVFVL